MCCGDVAVHLLSMALQEEFDVTDLMSCLTHTSSMNFSFI